MLAAGRLPLGPAALSAGPARIADTAAEVVVAVSAAGRSVPFREAASRWHSHWPSQRRRADEQRQASKNGSQSRTAPQAGAKR